MDNKDRNTKEYNDLSDEFEYYLASSAFLYMHPNTHAVILPEPRSELLPLTYNPEKVKLINVLRSNYTIDLFYDFIKAVSIGIVLMSIMYML